MKSAIAFGAFLIAEGKSAGGFEEAWQQWKLQYHKQYSIAEDRVRFDIFVKNIENISGENAKGMSHKLTLNQFSDLTTEEFGKMYIGGYVPSMRFPGLESVQWQYPAADVPDAVDWVSKGGVNAVKNQAQCGSCWAFSTVAAVEGQYFAASGNLVSLSEQQLVSCDNVDNGCGGGLMDNGFKFVEGGGLCTESAYPYTSGGGSRGRCQKSCAPQVTVTGFTDVPSGDENALKAAVAQGVVSVAIEADQMVFQSYGGGVLDKPGCGTQLDHGVAAVGYGTDGGKDYWKVRNSWGASWGESGYIRMARGQNYCGIALSASYPTGATAAGPAPAPASATPTSDSLYVLAPGGVASTVACKARAEFGARSCTTLGWVPLTVDAASIFGPTTVVSCVLADSRGSGWLLLMACNSNELSNCCEEEA